MEPFQDFDTPTKKDIDEFQFFQRDDKMEKIMENLRRSQRRECEEFNKRRGYTLNTLSQEGKYVCAKCGENVKLIHFKDKKSLKEFGITRWCSVCQNDYFEAPHAPCRICERYSGKDRSCNIFTCETQKHYPLPGTMGCCFACNWQIKSSFPRSSPRLLNVLSNETNPKGNEIKYDDRLVKSGAQHCPECLLEVYTDGFTCPDGRKCQCSLCTEKKKLTEENLLELKGCLAEIKKVTNIAERRRMGLRKFRSENYECAMMIYENCDKLLAELLKSGLKIKYLEPFVRVFSIKTKSNLLMLYLKKKEYKKAVELSFAVQDEFLKHYEVTLDDIEISGLKTDEKLVLVKILYRRANAYFEQKEKEKCVEDLQICAKIMPTMKSIAALLEKAKKMGED